MPPDATPSRVTDDAEHLAILLRRVGEGDPDAFTAFYHLTSRRVHGLALRTIIDAEMARETTQEVFLMVWKQAHKYDPPAGSPMAWLMTITHRRAVDKIRAESSSARRELVWGLKTHQADHDDVAETVADRLEAQHLARCLTSLTILQRESIHLAYYGGLTYREVAEQLGAPVPTVKARIRDGLNRLRSCLDAT